MALAFNTSRRPRPFLIHVENLDTPPKHGKASERLFKGYGAISALVQIYAHVLHLLAGKAAQHLHSSAFNSMKFPLNKTFKTLSKNSRKPF